jgi:hypothetical protein
MTPKRRDDDADLLAMAFGAAPFIDDLRAERDPDDDPEDEDGEGDGEDDEGDDEQDEDGLEGDHDELDF